MSDTSPTQITNNRTPLPRVPSNVETPASLASPTHAWRANRQNQTPRSAVEENPSTARALRF